MPGPNVVNLAVHLGDRARGLPGALAAFLGIIVVPTAFVVAIDAFLMQWLHIALVGRALVGLGAAAAGLVWAMGLAMGKRLRRSAGPLLLAVTAFLAAGPLGLSLPVVVLALGPVGIFVAWRQR